MIRFVRGSPFLSTLFGLSLLCGPLVVAVRGELLKVPGSKFRDPLLLAFVPANLFVCFPCAFMIFSIRHLEHVIGTGRCVVIGILAYFADWLCRTLLDRLFVFSLSSSGPYSLLTALLCLYCVFLPTVPAHFIPVNEKALLACLLLAFGLLDGFDAWILVAVGFVVFLMSAPCCFPEESPKRD
jgi:hypothetical protein